jgi:ABC-type lipoprotein release transport system permease subunit
LGARPAAIVALAVREGAALALAGMAIGAVAAVNATALLQNQLYGVAATDAFSYLVAVPVLGLAALAACWLPARRASLATPLDALRSA